MQKKNQNSFKNYYAMNVKELDQYIERIKQWLFNYPNHKNYKRVWFALEVALSAKTAKENKCNLIDYLL